MTLISILLVLGLSSGIAWLVSRQEKPYKWKLALLVLFCLVGGVLGNLILGFLNGLAVKYLYFDFLAVVAGAGLAYLLFRRLF